MGNLWQFVHHCIVHPLLGLTQLLTFGYYVPSFLWVIYDLTLEKLDEAGYQ